MLDIHLKKLYLMQVHILNNNLLINHDLRLYFLVSHLLKLLKIFLNHANRQLNYTEA